MKFGKQLGRASSTFPDRSYGENLINYKGLKKIIKKITAAGNHYLLHHTNNPSNPPSNDSTTTSSSPSSHKSKPPLPPTSEFYNRYALVFSTTVERELSKINQFYATKITSFQTQLDSTKNLLPSLQRLTQLSELCENMNALRRYIVLNYLGVMKIVKKHDKNSKIPVAQHLIPLLYAQPFYYSNTVASLYTEVEILYLKSPNLDEAVKNSRLDDYKCSICLNDLESPVVLSCCHRFCFKCLRRLHDSTVAAKILHVCPLW